MLKLVTYNIHLGLKIRELQRNVLTMVAQGVDIFCLQEIRQPSLERLMSVLGPGWRHKSVFSEQDNFDYNIGILWNSATLEALGFDTITLPVLDTLNWWQRVFERVMRDDPTPIRRMALVGVFKHNGRNVRVSNIHLDWPGGLVHRARQAAQISDYLKSHEFSGSEIVCGDCNTIGFFPKKSMEQIQAALGTGFSNALPHHPFTTTNRQSLDTVFIKEGKVLDARVFKVPGSDHFPVMVSAEV